MLVVHTSYDVGEEQGAVAEGLYCSSGVGIGNINRLYGSWPLEALAVPALP